MGSCTRRHFLLSTCFLQMITIIERQVFDFLGYMWAPIFVNFLQILFIIFGFYGAYHFRIKYILTYLSWCFLWIGWNAFLICFYMDVGELNKDSDLLNLGTGSVSWFEVNGYGCKPIYPMNITSDDPFRPIRPERVDDCLLSYPLIEVIHSGVQCALALFGILGAILISYIFLDEDDRLKHIRKKAKHRQSLYSIEFGPSIDAIRNRTDAILDFEDQLDDRNGGELSPKPMTPRRVKRRSVMARGSNSRTSTTSRRSHHSNHRDGAAAGGGTGTNSSGHSRSSMRNSRRKYHQSPVTKLLDQQQLQLQQPHSSHLHHQYQQQHHHRQQQQQQIHHQLPAKQQLLSFHHKDNPAALTVNNLQTLNQKYSDNSLSKAAVPSGATTSDSLTKANKNNSSVNSNGNGKNKNAYHSFRKNLNIPPDPIYYNTNGQAGAMLQHQSWQSNSQSAIVESALTDEPGSPTVPMGHFNPTYQHSTTSLVDGEPADEVYNNRPPSVRSSYSNFHGTRPHSTNLTNMALAENVFVNLNGAQQQQQQQQQPLYHQQHIEHPPQHSPTLSLPSSLPLPPPPSTPPQPLPFAKRTASRESIRSMAFLNSGPPAYNLNYHTPPDSETTM